MTAPVDRRLLLQAIAARPDGEKLNVGALTRAMAPTQEQVLAAITALVDDGLLDAQTLRPPPARPHGADLHDRIVAEADRRGISRCAASKAVFGYESALTVLGRGTHPVRADTLDKAERWLASESAPPARPMGRDLYRQVMAEAQRRGLSQTQAAFEIFGYNSQLSQMRTGRRAVWRATLDKVQAWLAKPAEPNALQETGSSRPHAGETEAGGTSTLPPASTDRQAVPVDADLLGEIEAYLARTGMAHTRFGIDAAHDHHFVRDLRIGRRPTHEMAVRVREFMAKPPPERVSGGQLHQELVDAAARHGVSLTTFCTPLYGRNHHESRRTLRETQCVQQGTAERVRAFIANPPAAALAGSKRTARAPTRQRAAVMAKAEAHIAAGTMAPAGNVRVVQLSIEAQRAEQARLADPVAQAQLALQRQHRTVYRASVVNRSAKKFVVSGVKRDVTEQELVALAEGSLTVAQINQGGSGK